MFDYSIDERKLLGQNFDRVAYVLYNVISTLKIGVFGLILRRWEMEDTKILEVIKAVCETKINWYWENVWKRGEVDGLAWLLDMDLLNESEILSIENSLQLLGGELAEKIANSDSIGISKNSVAQEVVITKMIKDEEERLLESQRSVFLCSIIACITGLVLLFTAIFSTLFVPMFESVKVPFIVEGILGLVVSIIGAKCAIRQKKLMNKAYEIAVNNTNSKVNDILKERCESIALLHKVDQCLDLINNSRF